MPCHVLVTKFDPTCRFLHARLRTCTLRSDFEGQATLLNLLLRNYLLYNMYDQADKLVSKSTFPESASNNEWARFLYYLGKQHVTFCKIYESNWVHNFQDSISLIVL